MRGQCHGHAVVANQHVWMVFVCLGLGCNAIHEPHRRDEVNELIRPLDRLADLRPVLEPLHGRVDLRLREFLHSKSVGGVATLALPMAQPPTPNPPDLPHSPVPPHSPLAQAKRTTRLAPSPTGALHLGNARTLLINWAMARKQGWRIVLRIEDLDTPRVKLANRRDGSDVISGTIDLLRWLGINWDEGPILQSQAAPHHRDAMGSLVRSGLAYPIALSRSQLISARSAHPQSAPNEGTHEVAFPAKLRPHSWFAMPPKARDFDDTEPTWRFVTPPNLAVRFADAVAGPQEHAPGRTVGDFIIWTRRDTMAPGQPAYQLAVVVDDARQAVTEIVRGDDLLDSTARQLLVAHALGLWRTLPTFYHLPLVRGQDGRRLAKRHGDSRLDMYRARGVSVEQVIGLIAFWSGLQAIRAPMDVQGFLDAFDLDKLPKESVVFGPEDEAWLQATS